MINSHHWIKCIDKGDYLKKYLLYKLIAFFINRQQTFNYVYLFNSYLFY